MAVERVGVEPDIHGLASCRKVTCEPESGDNLPADSRRPSDPASGSWIVCDTYGGHSELAADRRCHKLPLRL
jgi:hypothetical protein